MKRQSSKTSGKKVITKSRREKLLEIGRTTWWKPGVSGNPGGRPKLPEEIRQIQKNALEQAIVVLHNVIMDPVQLRSMGSANLVKFLETVFDRFGLPKVLRNEMSGPNGSPIKSQVDLSKLDEKTLKKLANEI